MIVLAVFAKSPTHAELLIAIVNQDWLLGASAMFHCQDKSQAFFLVANVDLKMLWTEVDDISFQAINNDGNDWLLAFLMFEGTQNSLSPEGPSRLQKHPAGACSQRK